LILIVSLYLIGKNQSFFGSNFTLKARFKNVNGLMVGNNVRYSGIQAGTVNKIQVVDDTTIEVSLLINKKMKPYIHNNAVAAIGNEGLMGNKVINITPNKNPGGPVEEGGLLVTKKAGGADDMMETLAATNDNVLLISESLKGTVTRLNNSAALWNLLNDTVIAQNLHVSIANIRSATVQINDFSTSLNSITSDIREGKGTAGALLSDETVADNLKHAVENVNKITVEANNLLARADSIVGQLQHDMNKGQGALHTVLKDTAMVTKLNNSMSNIEKGTAAFSQDMEALKHNVLTRGYFRKQEKKKRKEGK
jgi:phospholipid/cholesterol/gamma-HCH transport system substrate-binding protein